MLGIVSRLMEMHRINVCQRFLRKDRNLLSAFVHIDEAIPPKVYRALRKLNKPANGEWAALTQLVEEIKRHNCLIGDLDKRIKGFDYGLVLDDPKANGPKALKAFGEVAAIVGKYRSLPREETEFVSKISLLECHLPELIAEYGDWVRGNGLLSPRDHYVGKGERESLERELEYYRSLPDVKKGNGYLPQYRFRDGKQLDDSIERSNEEYIESHLADPLFDNVDGRKLDLEQRKAILADGDRCLLVAGAGTGKTLTICGKVKWLIERQGVDPKDILALSYSDDSTDELKSRFNRIKADVNIKTFHSLGLAVLNEVTGAKETVSTQYERIGNSFFQKEIFDDPAKIRLIFRYLSFYLKPAPPEGEVYGDEGQYLKEAKMQGFVTLRYFLEDLGGDRQGKVTSRKEQVKSYQELAIANYYFVNGIEYEYEKPYVKNVSSPDHRQYLPDFSLKGPHGRTIYHEHYGINKENEAPQFGKAGSAQYVREMEWKRNLHRENGTTCLETYSYEFDDGTIFAKLKEQLEQNGIEAKPISDERIREIVRYIHGTNDFASLVKVIEKFVSIYKANYCGDGHFGELMDRFGSSSFGAERAKCFLEICRDFYDYYEKSLLSEGKIDFDDMILKGKDELPKAQGFKYRYVIVDEFQDISRSRLEFLKALLKHGDSRLLAVGDDWQAIYRFAGSDVNLFIDFPKEFPGAIENQLTTTYRNSRELQGIAQAFVLANPRQIKKEMRSPKHQKDPVRLVGYSEMFGSKAKAFRQALAAIAKEDGAASVLVLGRNGFDLKDAGGSVPEDLAKDREYPNLGIEYRTIHKAKGLEADYVILVNAQDTMAGFPNKIEDDPLLGLLMSSPEGFPYAEERRLFYVALTRARKAIYILVPRDNPSIFVKEIAGKGGIGDSTIGQEPRRGTLCPYCKSGTLVARGKDQEYLACSNSPLCHYFIKKSLIYSLEQRCPECGDFLVKRLDKYGHVFLGCHNYSKGGCRFTKPLMAPKRLEGNGEYR